MKNLLYSQTTELVTATKINSTKAIKNGTLHKPGKKHRAQQSRTFLRETLFNQYQ